MMSNRKLVRGVAPLVHSALGHPHALPGRHVAMDGGDAFVPDYRHGFIAVVDDDAEALGEEFIAAATSAEAVAEDARDELMTDELEGLAIEAISEEAQE